MVGNKIVIIVMLIMIHYGSDFCNSQNKNEFTKQFNLVNPAKFNENKQGVMVEGYVKDKMSKTLIPEISININNDYPIATTDKKGFFQANIGYHKVFTIFAVGPDICSSNVTIDATGKDTVFLILETKPSGKIIGKVINEQKELIPNAMVRFTTSNLLKNFTTDSRGEFVIENIDPETSQFQMYIFADGYIESDLKNMKFPTGKRELALDIELNKQDIITIAGEVIDNSDKPIEGAVVSYGVFDNWKQYKATTTDCNGQFLLKNIQLVTDYNPKDDNLVFFARSSGYAPAWYKLKSSQDTVLHIFLPPSHYVSGRIVDTEGNVIRNTQISVMAYPAMKNIVQKDWIFNMWQHYYFPDDEGRFKIEDLPAEEVVFSIFGKGYTSIHYSKLPLDRDDLVVTLQHSGVVTGKVIDDQTGEPIHSFKVKIDRLKNNPETRIYFPLGYFKPGVTFNSADGYFTITELDLGQNLRIIVKADGYSEQEIEPVPVCLPPVKEKDKLVFRMKKSYASD